MVNGRETGRRTTPGFAAIKEIVRDAEDSKFQDALNRVTNRQLQSVDILYGSNDNLEGARAFAEKRDPV